MSKKRIEELKIELVKLQKEEEEKKRRKFDKGNKGSC